MRFLLERSGGVAGLVLRADVDASELPPDAVEAAVSADWSSVAPPAGRRDGFVYRLEQHAPDDALAPARAVDLADPCPDALRPLLDALLVHAQVAGP